MKTLLVILSVSLFFGRPVRAATIWDEGVNGALSTAQASPTPFTLSLGVSSVIGVVGGTNPRDFLSVTVPSGRILTSFRLASYTSADGQGFVGVQAGSSMVGSLTTPGTYMGYSHFGPASSNGPVGTNLLPVMANPSLAPGATGMAGTLPAGTYTFNIQQTGASSTAYQFDFTLVPEPGSLVLLALGGMRGLRRRRVRLPVADCSVCS